MLRKLLGAGLLLATVAGCTKLDERPCSSDADCGARGRCDTSVRLCYESGTEPPIDTGSCTPACAAYEACAVGNRCNAVFSGLGFRSPQNGAVFDGGTVQVVAEFSVNSAYKDKAQFPPSLVLSATYADGGVAGSFGTVSRSGEAYTTTWTPPATPGQITLRAAHPVPDAGLSGAVNVTVDAVPPTFNLSFSAPPLRSLGSAAQANEQDPTPGYEAAFRRDETVTVTVSANEPVNGVALTVAGIAAGGGVGQVLSVPVVAGGACAGNPVFCGTATVDLSLPEMNEFRGAMQFRVEGRDVAGNPGAATAELKVTRWKWVYDAVAGISGNLVVGNRGTLYFGTNVASGGGKMIAVGVNGARRWEALVGDVLGNPAVGAFASNEEYVYVAAKSGSGPALYALRGSDGTEKAKCPYSDVTELPGSLAVGRTAVTGGTAESGVGVYNGDTVKVVWIRPDVLVGQCPQVSGTGPTAILASIPGGSLVMKEQNIFYGGDGNKVTSYDLSTGSNSPRSGWPQDTNSFARALALSGDQLYGGASNSEDPKLGSLFKVPTAGGSFSFVYPQANTSRVFNLAIGSGNVAYFGAESASGGDLLSLPLDTPGATPTKALSVGTLRGSPVIGRNNRLYTLNTQGKLSAWTTSTLAPLWSVSLQLNLGSKDTSPTLDCRRDASGDAIGATSLGTLYFAGQTRVYAFIVDSPGLDPNAPWPRFQHDARNTGNPDTPITNCP